MLFENLNIKGTQMQAICELDCINRFEGLGMEDRRAVVVKLRVPLPSIPKKYILQSKDQKAYSHKKPSYSPPLTKAWPKSRPETVIY